jgi:NADP-dependent 3-hydroxy acid dehydrogenase YdfG
MSTKTQTDLLKELTVHDPKAILITGAAGGIGSALVRAYAAPGTHLFLGDLNPSGLEHLCRLCNEAGASARGLTVDVKDQAAMENWIAEADSIRPLDLVIANAGISHGNLRKEETPDEIRAVFDVNVHGLLNTVLPVLPLMRHRKRGQIALMGSLAGLRGFPHSPSYCASKAAVRVFGQGLRARLKREGVRVSVIIPAFVKTPMTNANLYRMPWRLDPDQAAEIIKRELGRGKSEFIFPTPYAVAGWALSAMPRFILDFATELK